jgi:hypothetical protein
MIHFKRFNIPDKQGNTRAGFNRLTPAAHWIQHCLYEIDRQPSNGQPKDITVTSGNDSGHGDGSKHYTDNAADVRSKNFLSRESKLLFKRRLENMLNSHPEFPDCFTVLFEYEGQDEEHFHVQVKKGMQFPPAFS